MKWKRYSLLFAVGGAGYGIIETLWRGYTHWTMIIAGGLCFAMFSLVAERFSKCNLVFKALICALGVTIIELIFGIIFNMIFGMQVWDYSDVPFNFMGQICLTFSVVWCLLAICFIPLAQLINRKLPF